MEHYALLLVLLAGLTSASATLTSVNFCYEDNTEYTSHATTWSAMASVATEELCQAACLHEPGCVMFTFETGSGACSKLRREGLTRIDSPGKVSGVPLCQTAGTDCAVGLPNLASFPGATALASNEAWSSGFQPYNLACWPKTSSNTLATCWKTEVIQDMSAGWAAHCRNLHGPIPGLTTAAACDLACVGNVTCKTWEFSTANACYQGTGMQCNSPGTSSLPVPAAAQRIMHGVVRVLMPLIGFQVIGLGQIFDKTNFGVDHASASLACKYVCMSDVNCEFWQYSNSSEHEGGCWADIWAHGIEAHRFAQNVAYPLTDSSIVRNRDEWIAGEYIQHSCPPAATLPPTLTTTTTTTPNQGNPWLWPLVGTALVCCAGGILALLCRPKKKKAPKKQTRTITPAPEPELLPLVLPEPVMYLPPVTTYTVVEPPMTAMMQPMYIMEPPMTTMMQPLTSVSAPLPTYAMPTQTFANSNVVYR